ncbi:unnamed protein product [Darwinula stevensoni]|uniref:Regulating synaptic membrane exocytosis protein 2 n=1 Tax=Darwinula stevensoni TaxID=69355 RepID=A0A7R9A6E2_9CRUS|nr:unnamed protein product [Darwinula stevensoni]CAG0894275.1 unnamed protein product [Darwinula stevensoni]
MTRGELDWRKKQTEVETLEQTIRQRNEEQRRAGIDFTATCQICLKTKFADGIGHTCHYCQVKCCARCGGKVTLRSNKAIWVCILCRKKQELLIKTGQWIHTGGPSGSSDVMSPGELIPATPTSLSEKRPKLERGTSSEKENRPSMFVPNLSMYHRPSPMHTQLVRQYSHDNVQPGHTPAPYRRPPPLQRRSMSDGGEDMNPSNFHPHRHQLPSPQQFNYQRNPSQPEQKPAPPPQQPQQSPHPPQRLLPQLRRHLPGQHPARPEFLPGDRKRPGPVQGHPLPVIRNDSLSSDQSENVRPPPPKPHKNRREKRLPQRSFSSSDEEVRSTPECTSCDDQEIESESVSEKGEREKGRRSLSYVDSLPYDSKPKQPRKSVRFFHNDPGCDKNGVPESEDEYELDFPKDSGIDTSSTFTSSEDSNKGGAGNPIKRCERQWRELAPSAPGSGRPWTIALRALIPAQTLRKKPSEATDPEGTKLIGHMILKKSLTETGGSSSSAAILGLKVVGGKILENGKLGAIIEKVKKGSIADTVGHLKPGDEVLEWNGRSLQGKTFEEVYDIIAESKQEPQVELMVCRAMSDVGRQHRRNTHAGITSHSEAMELPSGRSLDYGRGVRGPSGRVPGSDTLRVRSNTPTLGGRVQVRLWFDLQNNQLVVTMVCAVDLPPRKNDQPRNPYAKMLLLPDTSERSKRRTKTLANTCNPKWRQTFVYSPLRRAELRSRTLHVTVWDYDRYGVNDFLGEVMIELSEAPLNEEPEWYYLKGHDNQQHRPGSDHLSPPSTSSRLSDSEISELDEDTSGTGIVHRRTDGSSVASSSSPPLESSRRNPAAGKVLEGDAPPGDPFFGPRTSRSRERGPSGRVYEGHEHASRSLSPPVQETQWTRGSGTRSAAGTPIASPKKRKLPIVPAGLRKASKDRVAQSLNERAIALKMRLRSRGAPSSYRIPPPGAYQGGEEGSGVSPEDLTTSGDIGDSDIESVVSAFSTQSERGAARLHFGRRGQRFIRSMSAETGEKGDGSLSDGALGGGGSDTPGGGGSGDGGLSASGGGALTPSSGASGKARIGLSFMGAPGMGKKSSSTSQLSATGQKRRLVFGRRGKTSFAVQRSEEVYPDFSGSRSGPVQPQPSSCSSDADPDAEDEESVSCWFPSIAAESRGRRSGSQSGSQSAFPRSEEVNPCRPARSATLHKQPSRDSDVSFNSASSEGSLSSWIPNLRLQGEGELSDFVEGLGPGQLVGRQVLAAPALGDIQLSLCDRKGKLEVEVIRARGLTQAKLGAKVLPAPYVKVYLVDGKKCIEKNKTGTARRTLDPLYQELLPFHQPYKGCVLQVTVWGDYGRMEGKKVFMGAAQIMLDDLDLSNIVIGWYKLFGTSSLVSLPAVQKKNSGGSMESGM